MSTPISLADSLAFYDSRYDIIVDHVLEPGKKVILGDKVNRKCRFCGGREPKVTFTKEAHALPIALGNKSILTHYECDSCNDLFGRILENDFGKWSKPMRTMTRIRGRHGVPTLKRGGDHGWRIEFREETLHVTSYEEDPIFEIDEKAPSNVQAQARALHACRGSQDVRQNRVDASA